MSQELHGVFKFTWPSIHFAQEDGANISLRFLPFLNCSDRISGKNFLRSKSACKIGRHLLTNC